MEPKRSKSREADLDRMKLILMQIGKSPLPLTLSALIRAGIGCNADQARPVLEEMNIAGLIQCDQIRMFGQERTVYRLGTESPGKDSTVVIEKPDSSPILVSPEPAIEPEASSPSIPQFPDSVFPSDQERIDFVLRTLKAAKGPLALKEMELSRQGYFGAPHRAFLEGMAKDGLIHRIEMEKNAAMVPFYSLEPMAPVPSKTAPPLRPAPINRLRSTSVPVNFSGVDIRQTVDELFLTLESVKAQVRQLKGIVAAIPVAPRSLREAVEEYIRTSGKDPKTIASQELVLLMADLVRDGQPNGNGHRNGFAHQH